MCVLHVVMGADWPMNVKSACGFDLASNTTRTVFTVDGSETLQAPNFCASDLCRSSLSYEVQITEESDAFSSDLVRCASPSTAFAGEYTMFRLLLKAG